MAITNCRGAPIRNITVAKLQIQAAVFGVRLRELRWTTRKSEGIFSVEDLNAPKLAFLKRCQKESFHDAYKTISKGQPLSSSDQLNKISSFLDENGLLRLQGRLQHSKSSYEVKLPVLLSAKHYVVSKLIEDAHQANFHEGTEYVRSVLRQKIVDCCETL